MSDFECTECGSGVDVNDSELWELYGEEGTMFIDCPDCNEEICIQVSTVHSWECVKEEDL